jgi:SHS2 domain-containing protein
MISSFRVLMVLLPVAVPLETSCFGERPEVTSQQVPFRWIEHTGELELELDAPTERGIFEAGFDAMRELMVSNRSQARIEEAVALTGSDRASLLADWLGELAFLAEMRELVPEHLASLELSGDGVNAVVEGFAGNPPHLVKGATYHRLRFERTGDRWRARVVLDV